MLDFTGDDDFTARSTRTDLGYLVDDLSSGDGGKGYETDVLDGFVSHIVVLVHLEYMPQEDKVTVMVPF